MIKVNEQSSYDKEWRDLKYVLLNGKTQYGKVYLYDSSYMTVWKRQNYREFEKVIDC
jgi:hypothetical protein